MNFKKKKGRYILILLLLTLVFFYVNKLTNTVSLQEDEFTISVMVKPEDIPLSENKEYDEFPILSIPG